MELLKVVVFLAFLGLSSASLVQKRILNGESTSSYRFLHQVSLFSAKNGSHFCSGAIISDRWIVTAAECVNGTKITDIRLKYGTYHLSSAGKVTEVAKIVLHPEYNPRIRKNNLALIMTSSKIEFKRGYVRAVELPPQKWLVGDFAMVSGWGETKKTSNNLSDNLRFIVTSVMSVDECRAKYNSAKLSINFIHTNSSFCGRNQSGRRLSHGDIGDPIVSLKKGNQLIGVASAYSDYADNTMRTMPDIYTSIFPYVDWIQSHIHRDNQF